jgi:branched-chain amino acid transport system ATP-binding protein
MTGGSVALAVKDVTVRFGVLTAVDSVSLTVASGQVVALIGPNGAGKTTLLNAVSGLLPIEGGEILAGERDITSAPAHTRAGFGIKRTFQHAKLSDDLTVIENTLVGASTANYSRSLIGEWLRLPSEMERLKAQRIRASAVLDTLDLGDLADMPVSQISFGRKKMVDLARAMMTDPHLLLLDEPTAGLSEQEIHRLSEVIARIRQKTAILVVAHHMGFVNNVADAVICLVTGRVISRGSPQHVQSDPKVLAAYMGTMS